MQTGCARGLPCDIRRPLRRDLTGRYVFFDTLEMEVNHAELEMLQLRILIRGGRAPQPVPVVQGKM
jgi:hypothetical protein